jgi:hypothetical protein
VTGFSAATILVFAIASPLRAQGIEVCSGRLDKIAVSDRRSNRSSDLDRRFPKRIIEPIERGLLRLQSNVNSARTSTARRAR